VYFVGSLLALGVGFLYQIVSGRLLGPERYATVAAIFSLYFILVIPGLMVTTIGTRQMAAFRASGLQNELGFAFRDTTLKLLGLSMLGGFVFVALVIPIASFLHVPIQSLLALVPLIVLLLPTSLNRGLLQGEQRFVPASWVPLVEAVTRTALAAIFITAGLAATGAILALSMGVAASYAVSLLPLRHLVAGSAGRSRRAQFRLPPFTWQTMIAVLGITILYTVDVLLVKHFLSARQSGLYGAVVSLGRIIFMITFSLTMVMFAEVTKRFVRRLPSARVLAGSAIGVGSIGLAVVVAFALAPRFALTPFGSEFIQAAAYLPLYGGAMTMLSLGNLLIYYLVAIHDMRFVPLILLADLAQVALITMFHGDLWTVITIVFGVTTVCLFGLLTIVLKGNQLRPPPTARR
jgi:O-antigen/teichoic acid export membrane protein